MYRVELKGILDGGEHKFLGVPNVPCGVERLMKSSFTNCLISVPNAPCGVERLSIFIDLKLGVYTEFLMYRVELKVSKDVGKPFHCKLF